MSEIKEHGYQEEAEDIKTLDIEEYLKNQDSKGEE